MVELIPHQHLVVNTGDKMHCIPLWMIRQIARGELHADDELMKAIALALLDRLK
jgi:hypothetical protein